MQEAQEQIQDIVFLLNLCFTLPTDSRVTKIYHNMTTTKSSKDKEYWKENKKSKKWKHQAAAFVFAWAHLPRGCLPQGILLHTAMELRPPLH